MSPRIDEVSFLGIGQVEDDDRLGIFLQYDMKIVAKGNNWAAAS